MLFNSGTPSLVSFTRLLTGDPSTAPRTMFSDADIKAFLNVRYLELREKARMVGDGSALKIAYDTGVDGTYAYDMPADFIELRTAEIDLDGGNLSSLTPSGANIRLLEPFDFESAWQKYQTENLTDIKYIAVFDRQFAILAPVNAAAAGTNSIRFVYHAATTELSGDTDEPTINRQYHDLICRLAAVDLLATRNLENSTLTNIAFARLREYELAATRELWKPDYQAYVAGLDDQDTPAQTHGFIDW